MDRCSPALCSTCPDRIVCHCLNVTEADIIDAATAQDLRTIRDLKRHTTAGDGCTCCHSELQELLNRISLAVC